MIKDITITKKQQIRELKTLLILFVGAYLLNAGAIIYYGSPAKELVTSILYVVSFTLELYVLWVVIRLVWHGVKHFNRKKK